MRRQIRDDSISWSESGALVVMVEAAMLLKVWRVKFSRLLESSYLSTMSIVQYQIDEQSSGDDSESDDDSDTEGERMI